jgi:preprotein translocase subunit SecD
MMRFMGMAVSSLAVAAILGAAGPDDPPRPKVEFRRAQNEAAPGYTRRPIEGSKDFVYVHDKADFVPTPADVSEARVDRDERNELAVVIYFTSSGQDKLGALTGDWVDKRLAILVDGKVVAAPILRTKIEAAALISGNFTYSEAERIAVGLRGK